MYKPIARRAARSGTSPSGTLANREAASYVVSAAGGWDVVPPTVLRDGPAGRGTVQLWIEGLDGSDAEDGPVLPPGRAGRPGARREGGAGLAAGVRGRAAQPASRWWWSTPTGRTWPGSPSSTSSSTTPTARARTWSLDRRGSLWGFDHGLSFHEELKLRTVLWGWAGAPLPDVELSRLDGLAVALDTAASSLAQALEQLLAPAELEALRARVAGLLRTGPLPAARQPVARRPVAAAVTGGRGGAAGRRWAARTGPWPQWSRGGRQGGGRPL